MPVRAPVFSGSACLVHRASLPVTLAKKVYKTFKRDRSLVELAGSNTRIRWEARRLDGYSGQLIELVAHDQKGTATPRTRLFEIGYTPWD